MTRQYMPKGIHDPHKNLPVSPPTYLMYGPYFAVKRTTKAIKTG